MEVWWLLLALARITAAINYWDTCDPLKAQEELLSKVNDESYDSERQPATPLVVSVGYVVHDVMEINELSRYVDLQLTFYQQWQDDRLIFNTTCNKTLAIPFPGKAMNNVWMPSVKVTNALGSTIVNSPTKVAVLTVTPSGFLTYRANMVERQGCGMDYVTFPFDTVTCDFVIGTWLPDSFIRVRWIYGDPLDLKVDRIKLATFAVGNYEYLNMSTPLVGGRFRVALKLHRYYMYYLLTVYFPNALIILLAWSSFWFKPDGGRGGICMSTLMSLTLMMNGVAGSLPKVGYMKGIDLWFLVCIFLVVFAFLEYAFVAYMERMQGGLDSTMPFNPYWWKRNKKNEPVTMTVKEFCNILDRFFRVVFIGSFVIFCIVYVSVYYRRMPDYVPMVHDAQN